MSSRSKGLVPTRLLVGALFNFLIAATYYVQHSTISAGGENDLIPKDERPGAHTGGADVGKCGPGHDA